MSGPRIGSLCTGYGGLDLGVQAVIGGRTVWVSDIDKGSCKLLEYRYSDVPNLGDFTKTDWATVEPVDVLTAGFPCQPVSHAGKRLGDDDERWLWDDVARAVRELRPGLVVLENVRGLLTAGSGRLFGRVLGSLAGLGYDAQWHGLRAADVGAPHGRFRVFILATDTRRIRGGAGWTAVAGQAASGGAFGDVARCDLLPTPRATDGVKGGPNQRGSSGDLMLPSAVAHLLPTPTTQDGANIAGASQFDRNSLPLNAVAALLPTPAVTNLDTREGARANLHNDAARLLPTPNASVSQDGEGFDTWEARRQIALTKGYNGNGIGMMPLTIAVQSPEWGDYAAAIHRWEHTLGRPAPAPTQTSSKGNPQLAPAFVEWMMGLPAGWVTDVPGITRNEALKLCGNGVVPQQAEAALRVLLSRMVAA